MDPIAGQTITRNETCPGTGRTAAAVAAAASLETWANTTLRPSQRYSESASRTLRNAPAEETSRGAQLLIQGGFINQVGSGIYTLLPLGLRVVQRIEETVRQAMRDLGSQELAFPTLQPKHLLEQTNRWGVDVLYKLKGRGDKEFALAFTHEEACAAYMGMYIGSYRDLPRSVFQIQSKFRDEPRARGGLIRCKEFRMKDMYSFHEDQAALDAYYDLAHLKYVELYESFGLGGSTYLTYASGGDYSKYSHEYQTICPVGEDTIYVCPDSGVAINKEILAEVGNKCPVTGSTNLIEQRAVEVGNIFKLGTRFTDSYGHTYHGRDDVARPIYMASYGIGITRVMSTVAELRHDERGLLWPAAIAPFDLHLVSLVTSPDGRAKADALYRSLTQQGFHVLYDDRPEVRGGEKFSDCDLIGIPRRLVISEKSLKQDSIESKLRGAGAQPELVPLRNALDFLSRAS